MALEGPNVRLRAIEERDIEPLFRWYQDPDLVAPFDRFVGEGYAEFAASLRALPQGPESLAPRYAVELRDPPKLIGCLGYYRGHPVLEYWDVWYVLGDAASRGHGYGREAVQLLIGELFRTTSAERVGAVCDPENAASVRLLESLGLRPEGTLRSALFHHARWHDARVYGITRSDWDPARSPART